LTRFASTAPEASPAIEAATSINLAIVSAEVL